MQSFVMHRRALCLLLLFLGMGLGCEASAQGRAKRLSLSKPEKAARLAATAPAGTMPLLPRFWQMADSAERTDAAEVFHYYLQHFIHYPALAFDAGLGGAIYALLTVLPDGRVSSISITRRELSSASPPVKAVMALDAELQRVALQLRFKPAAPRADSVDVFGNRIPEAIDVTDVTESADSGEETDVTDVTDAVGAPIRTDTVTIYHRFALPQVQDR